MKISAEVVQKADLSGLMKSIDANTRKAIARATSGFTTSLKKRTQGGTGLKGGFKSYSSEYKKYKISKGKDPFKVNLRDTGSMMLSLTSRISGNAGYVYFNGGENNKKAYFNNQIRPFFGVTKKEQKEIDEIFTRYLK